MQSHVTLKERTRGGFSTTPLTEEEGRLEREAEMVAKKLQAKEHEGMAAGARNQVRPGRSERGRPPCWHLEFILLASEQLGHSGLRNQIHLCLGTSLVTQWLRIQLAVQETWVQFLGQEDPLENEMATHSSILAWKIAWTEQPGRLQGIAKRRIRLTLSLSEISDLVYKDSISRNGLLHLGRCRLEQWCFAVLNFLN